MIKAIIFLALNYIMPLGFKYMYCNVNVVQFLRLPIQHHQPALSATTTGQPAVMSLDRTKASLHNSYNASLHDSYIAYWHDSDVAKQLYCSIALELCCFVSQQLFWHFHLWIPLQSYCVFDLLIALQLFHFGFHFFARQLHYSIS